MAASADLILSDKVSALRVALMFVRSTPPLQQIVEALDQFASGSEFESYCRELYSTLVAEKYNASNQPCFQKAGRDEEIRVP